MIDRRFLLLLVCILSINEVVSFIAAQQAALEVLAFVAISGLFFFVALLSTDVALLVVLAELVVGGKGYLYHLEIGPVDISIRLSLFVILLLVWLFKRRYKKLSFFASVSPYTSYLVVLAAFVTLGFLNGLIRGYPFSEIFFDMNAYLYFLMAPVIFTSLENPLQRKRLYNLFFAGILAIGVKSLVMLGLFTHFGLSSLEEIYRWIRNSGVGEVTHIRGDFYRVFFQSQIFAFAGFLIAFGMLIIRILRSSHDDRGGLYVVSLSGLTAILISLSRSFWVGAIVSLVIGAGIMVSERLGWRRGFISLGLLASLVAVAGFLISWSLYFPFPVPLQRGGGGDALVRERFSRKQPALVSRSALIQPLLQQIRSHPVIGTGFGTSVSYFSSDPRVARSGTPAKYTTTAFELGWLDIAVKIGLAGALVYLIFLKRLIQDCWRRLRDIHLERATVSFGLLLALVGLTVTHMFSPYLNHPLGIGIVLLSAALLRPEPKKTV